MRCVRLYVYKRQGNICANYFEALFPLIDAINIDLKAFNESFYEVVSGDFSTRCV